MSKISPSFLLASMLSILFSSVAFSQAANPGERVVNPTPNEISSSSPNIQGKWIFTISGENRSTTCTFIQKGNMLTGKFRGDMGDLPVTGTIDKDRTIAFAVKFGGMSMKFAGTIEGKTMKGIVDLRMGRGRKNWAATK